MKKSYSNIKLDFNYLTIREVLSSSTKDVENILVADEKSYSYDDLRAKKVFEKIGLKIGHVFKGYTNARFINEHFNTSYGQWGRSRWELDQDKNRGPQADNMIVWIVHIDGYQRDGWKNFENKNTIIEDMTNGTKHYKGIYVRDYAEKYPYRIVIQKKDGMYGNDFIVRGLYKFDKERSNYNQHYYVKI